MAKINEALRQLRLERGMTQEEVAEQVGLTRQAVSSYESGRTQPGVDILQRLAEIYETDLTDIIYGRNQGVRLYNALTITAIVMAAVFWAVQLVGSVLLWVANTFYPMVPGGMTEAGKQIWATRSKLMDVWTALDGSHYGLFPLCCVALLVLTLCLHRPLSGKTKLLGTLCYAVASMAVVLPWALSDPLFPAVNYLITPGLCLIQLALFLLLSLLIDWLRLRKLARSSSTGDTSESPQPASPVPLLRRWWFWVLIGLAVLLALSVLAIFLFGGTAEIPSVENPSFTLNGEDYPKSPTLQDFLDRGWKQGKSIEQIGNFSEKDGVSNLTHTGYRLNSGENHVSAYLAEDDIRGDLEPELCRLRSLSFYGANVMSFYLNGSELATINRESILDALGKPDGVDEQALGVHYDYSMPEQGISKITFSFPGTLDAVGQILVVFDVG